MSSDAKTLYKWSGENSSNKLKKEMSRRQNLKKDQGFHTMDFIEEKFEKKLDEMEKSISSKLKNEFDAMI